MIETFDGQGEQLHQAAPAGMKISGEERAQIRIQSEEPLVEEISSGIGGRNDLLEGGLDEMLLLRRHDSSCHCAGAVNALEESVLSALCSQQRRFLASMPRVVGRK